MTIMRPPQQGHDGRRFAEEAGSWVLIGAGAAKQFPGVGEVGLAAGAGEQPVVADAVKALGQDVHEEAADELVGG